MAQPQKFIKQSAGRLVEEAIESVAASAGAGDAAKLVKLNGSGKLDASMMPVGLGADALTMVASENLSAGDFVNVWDDSGTIKARKADASTAGKEADGFVLDATTSGQSVAVYFESRNTGLTGLTLGARYYLSTTPGAATSTAPSGSGNVVQYLGRASTTSSLVFEATDGVILA
jgi:hypothetical protein